MKIKRFFDLMVVLVATPLWVPILVTVTVLVRWKIGKPIFFQQIRAGRGGELFQLIKFRTMTDARGSDGQLLPDEDRLKPFGCWLRSTSLDEVPTFLNVIKGDMSLVGPRPLLPEYLSLYSPRHARRHEVLPGVTGWAQVNGRNALSWDEKLALDVWYVDHNGFWIDLRILLLTLVKVIRREGVNAVGSVTMPEFMGIQSTNDHGGNKGQ